MYLDVKEEVNIDIQGSGMSRDLHCIRTGNGQKEIELKPVSLLSISIKRGEVLDRLLMQA